MLLGFIDFLGLVAYQAILPRSCVLCVLGWWMLRLFFAPSCPLLTRQGDNLIGQEVFSRIASSRCKVVPL